MKDKKTVASMAAETVAHWVSPTADYSVAEMAAERVVGRVEKMVAY